MTERIPFKNATEELLCKGSMLYIMSLAIYYSFSLERVIENNDYYLVIEAWNGWSVTQEWSVGLARANRISPYKNVALYWPAA